MLAMPILRLTQLFVPLALLACGGAVDDGDGSENSNSTRGNAGNENGGGGESQGSGGAGTARSGAAGSGVGGYVATGGASSGGAVACCLAAALCNPGDMEIPGPDACPPDAKCYSSSICCSTVWCVPIIAQCDAYPACDWGDEELAPGNGCPPGVYCYQRSMCGSTIACVSGGGAADGGSAVSCNPDAEPHRYYVGGSPGECAVIDFACPSSTEYFGNDCGCGCEQDSSCPEWIDCMPGPDPNPQCSQEFMDRCPYTQIAY
jgi:hypothetical protein